MTWLKRNLFLVIGGAIVIVLLGGAGYFLWSQKLQADGVTGELAGLITELQTLTGRDPFPSPENIEATKVEQKRVTDLLDDSRRHFVPTSTHTNMDNCRWSWRWLKPRFPIQPGRRQPCFKYNNSNLRCEFLCRDCCHQ